MAVACSPAGAINLTGIFYGAFVAKMLSLVRRGAMSGWVLPVLGCVLCVSLVALRATSALSLFTTKGVRS